MNGQEQKPRPEGQGVVTDTGAAVAARKITPMDMLSAAVERGDAVEKLTQLMDLYERWEAAQAKKAYTEAKAAFKANAPMIFKDMENKQYRSMYSSIGNVVNTMNAALSKYGLDASWDYDQTEGFIKVTCILTHSQGHSERVSLSGPPDNSGSKNPIQQIKSTTTYLKLATFEGVTGIASKEGNKDDDGNSAGVTFISETQITELTGLAEDNNVDVEKFCKWAGIDDLSGIQKTDYQKAKNAILAKGKQLKETKICSE